MNKPPIWFTIVSTVVFGYLLIGCSHSETPQSSASTLVATVAQEPGHTPIARPSLAPPSAPTPDSTDPPYSDQPFSIVFIRNHNLWLAEIGGNGEHPLTNESNNWAVHEYAISPACDRIAYIPYAGSPTADALIKAVDISSGSITVLTGKDDPYSEINIKWLDDQHIAFQIQGVTVPGHEHEVDPNIVTAVITPFNHVVMNLTTGQRSFVPESTYLSLSPDGRYWLSCFKNNPYAESGCQYQLRDRITKAHWPIAKDSLWGSFDGWSPDSQLLMFSVEVGKAREPAADHLRTVNVVSQEEHDITPENTTDRFGAWSPDGRTIIVIRCSKHSRTGSACGLWMMKSDGTDLQRIPVEIAGGMGQLQWTLKGPSGIGKIAWTPDGSRLVFTRPNYQAGRYDVWSVRTDGSDLRQVVSGIDSEPTVLCGSKEAK